MCVFKLERDGTLMYMNMWEEREERFKFVIINKPRADMPVLMLGERKQVYVYGLMMVVMVVGVLDGRRKNRDQVRRICGSNTGPKHKDVLQRGHGFTMTLLGLTTIRPV